ncbi:uncharacterized protein LOC143622225 [Bidens hawaiensis]|uniref:uncharacterized protein LOC143622225 n=1 Tax=Bidens hawaiensis TaxID=980011 RepID=UPI00404A619D
MYIMQLWYLKNASDKLGGKMSSLIHSIGIDMILIFFVFVILSRLPLFHSATPKGNSMPICPVNFTCPALTTFKYPFYNGTDTRCGLIKVKCTAEGGEIQIGGMLYIILSKFDYHGNSSRLLLWNHIFDGVVKNKSCEALMNNFTTPSPRPLLYSISIVDSINLFKCQKKNLTYFKKHKYNSYTGCKDHNFYYNYSNTTVPSDLPHTCQVVQLPVNTPSALGFNETNIFSLLSPGTPTFFNLSHSCSKCQDQNRSCGIAEGVVYCFDVKKGIHIFFYFYLECL